MAKTINVNALQMLYIWENINEDTYDILDSGGEIPTPYYAYKEREENEKPKITIHVDKWAYLNSSGSVYVNNNMTINPYATANGSTVNNYEDIVGVVSGINGRVIIDTIQDNQYEHKLQKCINMIPSGTNGYYKLYGKRKTDGVIGEIPNVGWGETRGKNAIILYNNGTSTYFQDMYINTSMNNTYAFKASGMFIESNVKLFKSTEGAMNYLRTGDESDLLGGKEEPHPTKSGTYIYDVNKFVYTDYAMQNNTDHTNSRLEIEFTDYPSDIYDSITHFEPIVCLVDDRTFDSSVQFKIHSGFAKYITRCSIRIGNIETPITNPLTAVEGLTSFGYGMGFNASVNGYAKYMVHTNITIIGPDGTALPPTTQLGNDVMIPSTNNANFDVGLSECWILSEHNMEKLARCFNTTVNKLADNSGGYIVAEWLIGLSSYSNPLDVVCDLFYLPVNVSDYTDTDNGHFNFTPTMTEMTDDE